MILILIDMQSSPFHFSDLEEEESTSRGVDWSWKGEVREK